VENYETARQATDINKIGIWRMCFFCWITKATRTDKDAEYAVLFVLPRQQWLSESSSMLHIYVGYITSLVKIAYGEKQVYILQNSTLQLSVVYIIILAI
jgi:hypothetical protein